jgi:plastocyanin domain-containing protein
VTTAQLLVTLAGAAAIVWVNYYFLHAGRAAATAAAPGADGSQRVRIEVKGGYTPARVLVESGRPVRLEFHRSETSGCTEEVVLPDFGIRTFLKPFAVTPVEFTPTRPGEYEFTCGMGMVRGRIVVEDEARRFDELIR